MNLESKIETVLFFKDVIYLFLERGDRREKERERNIHVWLPPMHPPLGDPASNPGMCHDWELNQGSFGSQAGAQCTKPHQPGQNTTILYYKVKIQKIKKGQKF